MKQITLIITFLLTIISANSEPIDSGPPNSYFTGTYDMIGRDSDGKLYSGKVTISETKNGLTMVRDIGGVTTKSDITFEYITSDKIRIMKTTFFTPSNDLSHEAIYEIHSNAGNYPILNGNIHVPSSSTTTREWRETLYYKE